MSIKHSHLDLRGRAHLEMVEHKFTPDFEQAVAREVQALEVKKPLGRLAESLPDLRSLLWSSIDNDESLDLDQIEYAERLPDGDIRANQALKFSVRFVWICSLVGKGQFVEGAVRYQVLERGSGNFENVLEYEHSYGGKHYFRKLACSEKALDNRHKITVAVNPNKPKESIVVDLYSDVIR